MDSQAEAVYYEPDGRRDTDRPRKNWTDAGTGLWLITERQTVIVIFVAAVNIFFDSEYELHPLNSLNNVFFFRLHYSILLA
jgi:hypothetical protein